MTNILRTKSVKVTDDIETMRNQQKRIVIFLNDILLQSLSESSNNNYERLFEAMQNKNLIKEDKNDLR